MKRVAGIESGAECERLAQKLSAFADGEAPAADATMVRRHLRGCLACKASLRELHLVPAAVGALVPLPFLERISWPVERFGELAAMAKIRLDSFVRIPGLDAASSPTQFAVAGGTRGLTSTGLAKALAVLCLGGAGAGGAVAVEQVLDPRSPESARAAEADSGEPTAPRDGGPTSPDPRLVAERLGAPDRSTDHRQATEKGSVRSPTAGNSLHSRSGGTAANGANTPPTDPDTPASDALHPDPASQGRGPREGSDARPSQAAPPCSDDPADQPQEEPPAQPYRSDDYGQGVGGPREPSDGYGQGVGATPETSDGYGRGVGGPPETSDGYGHGVGGTRDDAEDGRCDEQDAE